MDDPIPATHWGDRMRRVMDWADELGATEEITPRIQMKYVQTMEEIHNIRLFLEGLELLLGDEKFGSLRQETAQSRKERLMTATTQSNDQHTSPEFLLVGTGDPHHLRSLCAVEIADRAGGTPEPPGHEAVSLLLLYVLESSTAVSWYPYLVYHRFPNGEVEGRLRAMVAAYLATDEGRRIVEEQEGFGFTWHEVVERIPDAFLAQHGFRPLQRIEGGIDIGANYEENLARRPDAGKRISCKICACLPLTADIPPTDAR